MKMVELSKSYQYQDTKEAYEIKFNTHEPLHLSFSLVPDIDFSKRYNIVITLTHKPESLGEHYGRIERKDLDFDCMEKSDAKMIFKIFVKLFTQLFEKRFYHAFQENNVHLLFNVAWNLVRLDLEI